MKNLFTNKFSAILLFSLSALSPSKIQAQSNYNPYNYWTRDFYSSTASGYQGLSGYSVPSYTPIGFLPTIVIDSPFRKYVYSPLGFADFPVVVGDFYQRNNREVTPPSRYAPSSFISGGVIPTTSTDRGLDPNKLIRGAQKPNQVNPMDQIDMYERWMLGKVNLPAADQLHKDQAAKQLLRSLINPREEDVLSGAALNSILFDLIDKKKNLALTKPIPIPDGVLRKMNFSRGSQVGSSAFLQNRGQLPWPKGLLEDKRPDFVSLRKSLETNFLSVLKQAKTGNINPEDLKKLSLLNEELRQKLVGNASTWGLGEFLNAKQFVKNMDDTILFLKQPDVQNWLPGKHAFKNKTIQEMISCMAEKGLRFAPATVGSDAAYKLIHRDLVQYYHQAVQISPVPLKQQ